jgi:hypothetical protein
MPPDLYLTCLALVGYLFEGGSVAGMAAGLLKRNIIFSFIILCWGLCVCCARREEVTFALFSLVLFWSEVELKYFPRQVFSNKVLFWSEVELKYFPRQNLRLYTHILLVVLVGVALFVGVCIPLSFVQREGENNHFIVHV